MASLTLRPTLSGNQEAELFWFGSPHMDYHGNWKIKVAFRTATMSTEIVSYPWGTLPNLRIGQLYTDGKYDPVKPISGSPYHLSISNFNQGIVTNGFKLPKRLIDFGKNPELGLQNIIQFKADRLTYCIPVIEFIRAMFINSKNLAIQLLQPHGLELLVDRSEVNNETLYFDMSKRVPQRLATESNAQHMSWIYSDVRVRAMWDSVYQHIFSQAIKSSPQNPNAALKKGIPLNVDLPDLGPIEMYVRGEKVFDYILVKEIIGFSGFRHPHKNIIFWHPSKKQIETRNGDKHVRLTSKPDNDEYILNDDSKDAKEDTNQDVLEAPPTFMRFSNSPVVTTRKQNKKRSNTGSDIIVTTGRGGKNSGSLEEVSTQDSAVGGDTPPIDFQTLETIPVTEAFGLESFFEMVHVLKETMSAKINLSVLRTPHGKRFSTCPNGSRRTCAVVQVVSVTSTAYIIEVARPDNWSISTLILKPNQELSLKKIEQNIKLLLEGLVEKGGHWDQYVLDRCKGMEIEKVKHYRSDTNWDWANRLLHKSMI
ncbi:MULTISPECIES: Tn7-like element transposition protein TnsE [Paenibacillus]|uniref:TnsE C-terminal domain-containing protein n=1 Tax=Paenibacillus odorifer TaxID=189426 RepID=A0ABX3H5Z2_9BACL|nr:Tn7-like element transposition protein TnsE [Paenibacillus odorifer]OMD45468.1 hypothetical protein BSK51_29010 [Paenibacillus odorifer]